MVVMVMVVMVVVIMVVVTVAINSVMVTVVVWRQWSEHNFVEVNRVLHWRTACAQRQRRVLEARAQCDSLMRFACFLTKVIQKNAIFLFLFRVLSPNFIEQPWTRSILSTDLCK